MKYKWEAIVLADPSASTRFENEAETTHELVSVLSRIPLHVEYAESYSFGSYLCMHKESAIVISDNELIVMAAYGSHWYRIRRTDR